ncbi:reductive dehalogenase [Ponticoccus sp. SC2-23]|uniref:reductive dehalogenase n=1 Tax=Alexandriicola marinus TaxID=2081710 RepID=UPI000FD928A9|nr:reductive dehalogenase [Alexandriicola marinus]MBM1221724.1 reductive dehalogenase [Ponticoccus sp. SC6-9]MBM1226075.1 reductive dehalogenase [Ponticoccus sp. SC6-15]MBM1230672.1 reductive dehalogenase [Ponticoccus sp. SC6-38]MBM1235488.1 reductive dehalogenase [Ponticoccus sp. SC6-45]MBM1239693.1 reductive dehalogenase [Ponticoccus sp. SC6-49]MBM1243837.1 reductive dehalogenase [Ponticoccus sp. SC2-64]MBM1249011.1 reductive dehalogenase [Ponticoccus sp. SC6-42]MBM1253348.1 reductive deh
MGKLFSYRNRAFHYGPYPLEKLPRRSGPVDLSRIAPMEGLSFRRPDDPLSIVNAMQDYQAMLDATRDGLVKRELAEIPDDPVEQANHLKSFGYYCDASMVGICEIPSEAWLEDQLRNPDVGRLAEKLETMQTKTLAAGIDVIMAGLKESMRAPPAECRHHSHAIVFLYDMPRDPRPGEKGCDWIADAQAQRACLRGMETAVTLANYIRLLGRDARAHSQAASDIHLGKLAVAAGLVDEDGINPFLGRRYGLAVITTTLAPRPDRPLARGGAGLAWTIGAGSNAKNALNRDPFARREFRQGPHPFETLRRVAEPTTYIDAPNVARVPKRANMFARSLFGDLGKATQEATKNGNYVRKSASAFAFRPSLGAFCLLQDGEAAGIHPSTEDPLRNARNIKAASYFLGVDAVGLSACPDWAYYSHDAGGQPITPYHGNAISMIIDQGHETMEGASGDDWIACAQSMRAYLRFSLLGGVLAQHIRNLGYTARVHTVMDDEVLHPPLLLLSGLGEVSRIGEVILNPFLGPRLKSGVVTTNMPMTHDKPIDFGLQRFCEACNKCARECPSGAITAGPKLMFNGYEIWKSDSQKCTTYRVSQKNGAMCGRCMKTCPWNLEGLFAEAPFRWAAMNFPGAAKALARLDDVAGNGEINRTKTWWWDLEMVDDGAYRPPSEPPNARRLSKSLDLKFEDQTLAVYPAPLAPPPYAYPFPMDREAGIRAYQEMITAEEHKARRARGEPPEHLYTADQGESPVMQVVVSQVDRMTPDVTKYEFSMPDGSDMPPFEAGAHIDVVVAPEFLRQYSLSGNPADRTKYQIAVLREDRGRGGSRLMSRIFEPGRRVFISRPINHFPLSEDARFTYLMGGGIGVTPMIAMAHRLHAIGADFVLHYSCSRRADAGFLDDLAAVPWADKVRYHVSDEGTRCDLSKTLVHRDGAHVYTCGPEAYMEDVIRQATANGFKDEALHLEYFSVPEQPEYENHPFTLRLARSGRTVEVAADQAATDALLAAGVHVDVKCSDGLCGVCKCTVLSGTVEHRDFVLSNKDRASAMILCQSRAADPNGTLEIDL